MTLSNMLSNEIIIINTSAPLRNMLKGRPHHYAEILSRSNRVINVSSTAIRNYFRFRNKLSWQEKIYFRLPGTRFQVVQKLNKWLYGIFFQRIVKRLPQEPILWYFYSGNYDIVKSLPNKISILEICDDTPEYFADNPEKYGKVKQNEDKMTQMVDIVFTISDHLKQKKIALRPDIMLIRNGVDYHFFWKASELEKTVEDELSSINSPIVGYHGAISPWIDFDLIKEVACHLPEYNFVFIGTIRKLCQSKIDYLSSLPNVFFLGEKRYSDLIHYLKYFDVTIIPFVIDPLILSVNPIKMYEYLAAGKPVLSTPLPEVKLLEKEGIVETASNPKDFALKIQKLYEFRDTPDLVRNRMALAFNNSWDVRYKELEELVYNALVAKGLIS